MVGPTRHGVRLYALIVGKTARARKGDSWQFPAALMRRADPDWFEQCVTTGMSTGEGLIAAVRDAVGDGESAPPDRRVLALETELGRTLRVMTREDNTLSAVLRDAWDARDLRVMTRARRSRQRVRTSARSRTSPPRSSSASWRPRTPATDSPTDS